MTDVGGQGPCQTWPWGGGPHPQALTPAWGSTAPAGLHVGKSTPAGPTCTSTGPDSNLLGKEEGRGGQGEAGPPLGKQSPRPVSPPHRSPLRPPPGWLAWIPAGSAPPPRPAGPRAHPGRLCWQTGASPHSGQTRCSASSPVAGSGGGSGRLPGDPTVQATHPGAPCCLTTAPRGLSLPCREWNLCSALWGAHCPTPREATLHQTAMGTQSHCSVSRTLEGLASTHDDTSTGKGRHPHVSAPLQTSCGSFPGGKALCHRHRPCHLFPRHQLPCCTPGALKPPLTLLPKLLNEWS